MLRRAGDSRLRIVKTLPAVPRYVDIALLKHSFCVRKSLVFASCLRHMLDTLWTTFNKKFLI